MVEFFTILSSETSRFFLVFFSLKFFISNPVRIPIQIGIVHIKLNIRLLLLRKIILILSKWVDAVDFLWYDIQIVGYYFCHLWELIDFIPSRKLFSFCNSILYLFVSDTSFLSAMIAVSSSAFFTKSNSTTFLVSFVINKSFLLKV